MKGYFAIDVNHLNSTLEMDYRFLFKSIGKVNPTDLADALTASMRRVTYPDIVAIIVCSEEEANAVKQVCHTDAHVEQALKRASDKISVVLLRLLQDGSFSLKCFVKNPDPKIELILNNNYPADVYKVGLESLLAIEKVLVKAPAGFTFLKPSGSRSSYFIKAENALFESENVYFLACSLLKKIKAREDNARPIEVIFIDTMAISSLAYTLRDLYDELYDCEAKPRVVSFHSYSGISDIDYSLPGHSLCIISASSSMDMQRKWLNLSSCLKSEVITLLTLKDAAQSEQPLYSLPITSEELKNEEPKGLRDIRILGEMFSREEIEPKQVLLNLNYHKLAEWSKKAPSLSNQNALLAFRATQQDGNAKPIFVDGDKIFEYSREEITKYVLENVPVSTKCIIYQKDESSKSLAEFCAKLINEHLKIQIQIESPDRILDNLVPQAEGLLIVATVVGKGEALNSISRDLRGIHKGTRRFMIVFQIAESKATISYFKKNLEQSSSGQMIKVDALQSLAVGMTQFTSLEEEVSLFESLNCNLPRPVAKRICQIKKNGLLNSEFFLPSSVDPYSKLTLRPDFAFWDNSYDQVHDHSATVLATLASCLQHAREEYGIPDRHRLYSSALQQVVLDPENFSRFNDGIIQAALLRAAYPSELDYSSIPDASRRLARFLQRLFQNSHRDQGEASLEFAFALAIGKLKLERNLHKELAGYCQDKIQRQDDWGELLKCLLDRSINPDTPKTSF